MLYKEGIDYNEIFSWVVKYTTIEVVLALVNHLGWDLEQLDVKTTFLHENFVFVYKRLLKWNILRKNVWLKMFIKMLSNFFICCRYKEKWSSRKIWSLLCSCTVGVLKSRWRMLTIKRWLKNQFNPYDL